MIYNEYWQVVDAGVTPSQLVVFKYQDEGVATLEDGIYSTESRIKDPAMRSRLARFVKASMRGWEYAITHQAEAVNIVMAADTSGALGAPHQTRQLAEIAKLIAGGKPGYLDYAAANRTVHVLLGGASKPVITHPPAGAWTHAVWDAAYGGKVASR